MGAAYFYHLTERALEAVLPTLLGKARGAGWMIEVRGSDAARMAALDERLWLNGGEESFVPHGLAGGAHDAMQPILLTTGQGASNAPACLMAIDAAPVSAEEVSAFERVCILFDGNDPVRLEAARAQWKALTGAGCAAQYWAEDGGRWAKKAESSSD